MQHISFQKASIDYSETQVCADIENARATVFFIQDYISNLVNPAQVQTVELGQALDMVVWKWSVAVAANSLIADVACSEFAAISS